MALPIIGGIISSIGGVVKTWLNRNAEKSRARHERDLARINANTKVLSNEQHALQYWEAAQLADKDKWLRRGSFTILSLPIIWAIFDPAAVHYYFNTVIASMPEWYIKLYATIIGAVWGIHASRDAVLGLVKGIFSKNKGEQKQ